MVLLHLWGIQYLPRFSPNCGQTTDTRDKVYFFVWSVGENINHSIIWELFGTLVVSEHLNPHYLFEIKGRGWGLDNCGFNFPLNFCLFLLSSHCWLFVYIVIGDTVFAATGSVLYHFVHWPCVAFYASHLTLYHTCLAPVLFVHCLMKCSFKFLTTFIEEVFLR